MNVIEEIIEEIIDFVGEESKKLRDISVSFNPKFEKKVDFKYSEGKMDAYKKIIKIIERHHKDLKK